MKRNHIAKELGPRTMAMKQTELAVVRALALIKLWDGLPKGAKSWEDDIKGLSSIFETYPSTVGNEINVLWERYKSKDLHRQVLELAENVDIKQLSKARQKEVGDGISAIRRTLRSRSQG